MRGTCKSASVLVQVQVCYTYTYWSGKVVLHSIQHTTLRAVMRCTCLSAQRCYTPCLCRAWARRSVAAGGRAPERARLCCRLRAGGRSQKEKRRRWSRQKRRRGNWNGRKRSPSLPIVSTAHVPLAYALTRPLHPRSTPPAPTPRVHLPPLPTTHTPHPQPPGLRRPITLSGLRWPTLHGHGHGDGHGQ